jgi:hypothetical protein
VSLDWCDARVAERAVITSLEHIETAITGSFGMVMTTKG